MKRIVINVLALIGLFSLIGCAQKKEQKQPNIIFIMSDDHSTEAISAYGGRLAQQFPDLTPNIDRLAKEGTVMQNTFCTNAICGPSRAAILTGKFSHQNGFFKNESGGDFDGSQQTFPKLLQKAGYETAVIGKWHLGTAPTGFDYSKVMINHGGQGTYFNTIFLENGQDTVKETRFHSTRQVWEDAKKWLTKGRDQEKPFMLMYQFKAPHRPWEPDPQFQHVFDDVEIVEPETFNDTYEGKVAAGDTWMTIERNLNRKDLKVHPENIEDMTKKEIAAWYKYGNNNEEPWSPNDELKGQALKKWKYQKYMKEYLGCVKGVDHYIGEMLNYLDENGLAENTIVIYTSDQGFYLGEHGWFDKRMMYEEAYRMPFLIRYPGHISSNTVSKKLTMNVDFAPTLLDYAGVTVPSDIQGKSFRTVLEDDNAEWRDAVYYHYYEFPWWHHVRPHYGLRTDRYKLIHFYYNPEAAKNTWIDEDYELFDLENDPNELNNLYGKPGYEEITAKLKAKMDELQKEYKEDSREEMMKKTDVKIGRVYEHANYSNVKKK
ncbi:sulfatase [Flammeovirga yaeyamensis]|uniref:Sulfatase n=1 Tax=Flammeovirga yaeyamensis TaxID=367791 RepID=A0AAX1NF09_9BACT|nr:MULTISPECIES: sulfatase [Flammeovirga]ANQ52707.2 sulfatase [Flammeovirga sp. MY04]MBB3697103.1 arylsulfatase A-like enzyme [Flammeovirga yaeyamensis]NMF33766.1 sulfatase [Flammeovirga yaeyamensis]QWG04968.1 sulfatase [Flammeovirga yaeyamensis]